MMSITEDLAAVRSEKASPDAAIELLVAELVMGISVRTVGYLVSQISPVDIPTDELPLISSDLSKISAVFDIKQPGIPEIKDWLTGAEITLTTRAL